MILFFKGADNIYYLVGTQFKLNSPDLTKLQWLFGNADFLKRDSLEGVFIGPRKEMITPWSTNAVEITRNMGIMGISRIEELYKVPTEVVVYDRMLQFLYMNPGQSVFSIENLPEPVINIEDIRSYNLKEGLALSDKIVSTSLIMKKSAASCVSGENCSAAGPEIKATLSL